jgi:hypothetical protein
LKYIPKPQDPSWLKVQPRNYAPGLAGLDPRARSDAAASDVRHIDDGVEACEARRREANDAYVRRISESWKQGRG